MNRTHSVLPCLLSLAFACGTTEPGSEAGESDADSTATSAGEASGETSASEDSATSTQGEASTGDGDGDGDESTTTSTGDESGDGDTGPDVPLPTDARNYIFGHSLLLHSDTQNVPMWLAQFSAQAGGSYEMAGQYGFSDTHAMNLPPFAQWGVPGVTGAWDEDAGESFSDVDFNVVLFTAANFRQYYPPTETDPDGFLSTSVVENTIAVFDWVDQAEPEGVRYIIYENWPDMAGYTSADFGGSYPSAGELQAYWDYTRGDFHDWWVDYQDAMLSQRPELSVRMVPVGPVLGDLLTGVLADIPPEALYEDDAPHGQPTLYFLAGLVTYMAVYGEEPPADFVVPDEIHPLVADNYAEVVDIAWAWLDGFDDDGGHSRVW